MNRGYEPSRVVHLRNLPEDIDMDDVMELGRPFGPVISALRIKETQAFLYMQELKDAEDLVNEYRDHPPKIGWRTVFVQYSQYTRLDVGPRTKPDTQGRARQHNTGTDRHVRDRSRERSSRRSSSPDSPPSPPLPDITVPFYMLPRSDDPEITIPPTSRPQLVAYPHLSSAARLPPVSYPVPQTHDGPAVPLISYPTSGQKLDNSSAQPEMTMAPGNDANVEQYQQMPYQPPPTHSSYDERSCQPPDYYNDSTAHNIDNHHQHHHLQQQQSVAGQADDQSESRLNYLHSVIDSIVKYVQMSRHKATSDLLGYVTNEDGSLAEQLRHDFGGDCSLPVIVSTIVALRQLDDGVISSLVCLDTASVYAVTQQHSFTGVDDFAALFQCVAQTIHASGGHGQTHPSAKRRRYNDSDGVNNFASTSSSSSAASATVAHLQPNQLWNNAADYHRHQLH